MSDEPDNEAAINTLIRESSIKIMDASDGVPDLVTIVSSIVMTIAMAKADQNVAAADAFIVMVFENVVGGLNDIESGRIKPIIHTQDTAH